MREQFAEFYGAGHIIDQTLHPGMHETHSIDIICLLQGEASLVLELRIRLTAAATSRLFPRSNRRAAPAESPQA
jgi:hypothetical protein